MIGIRWFDRLLGLGIAVLALAPAIAIIGSTRTSYIYWGALATVFLTSLVLVGAKARLTPANWPMVMIGLSLFLAMLLVRSFGATDPFPALLSIALCWAVLLLARLADLKETTRGAVWTLLVMGVCVAAYTYFNPDYEVARRQGYSEVDLLYLITGPAIAAAVGGLTLWARTRRTNWGRGLAWAVTVLLMISLSQTLARTALVSGLASFALALAIPLDGQQRGSKLPAFIIGVAALTILVPTLLSFLSENQFLSARMARLLDPARELTEGGRGLLWRQSWLLISDRPLFGWGTGESARIVGIYAHNAFLQAWADLGIIGLTSVALVVTGYSFSFWRVVRGDGDWFVAALHLAALVYVAEALKSGDLYQSRAFLLLACLAPMAAWSSRRTRP